MKRSRALTCLAAAATAAGLVMAPATASASVTVSDPIASGLAGPLQLDVGKGGVYVAQSFAGLLTRINRDGSTTDVAAEPGAEIAGIATRRHEVAYTTTSMDEANPASYLKVRYDNGKTRTVANLRKFEEKRNPDSHNTYGFLDLTPECAAQIPEEIGGEPYTGIVDSHPYALARGPRGGWYVAEAGGNAILYVSRHGWIKVVSVLKPQPLKVTADAAEAVGLPECTVGSTYAFEPVPTDVEVSRSGQLFVTLLPGGPEDPSLGARGSLVRVNPWNHKSWKIAGGFLGATNLALAPRGKIFVTELFGNKLSVVKHGRVWPVADLPSPAAVEYAYGKLFVSTDVFANGSVVTVHR